MARIRSPNFKTRHFFIRTYLSEKQLNNLISSHNIQHYAYIRHDEDITRYEDESGEVVEKLVEPHFHVILSLYNANSLSSIKRWFSGWIDDKNMLIQSHCEVADNRFECFDYLTHETLNCRARGDVLYSKSDIVSDCIEFFDNPDLDVDLSTLILLDMLDGKAYSEMVVRYGKFFIMNFRKFEDIAWAISHGNHFSADKFTLDRSGFVYQQLENNFVEGK